MVARAFLAVSDHGSRARDKNLATLNKGGKDNRRQRNRGGRDGGTDFSAHATRAHSLVRFVLLIDFAPRDPELVRC